MIYATHEDIRAMAEIAKEAKDFRSLDTYLRDDDTIVFRIWGQPITLYRGDCP